MEKNVNIAANGNRPNPLRGKIISLSREFLIGLKPAYTMETKDKTGNIKTVEFPMSGRTVILLLIGLTQFDSKSTENEQWVQLFTGDVKEIFGKAKCKYKDFTDFLKQEGEKVKSVYVNDLQIIDSIYTENKTLYIHYTDEAMPFFQGLGGNHPFLQISTNTLIATDCSRDDHTWNWLRYLLIHTNTERLCHFEVSNTQIKRFLHIPFQGKGSYMRSCGLDRKNFEDVCITAPLEKIASTRQYHLNRYKDSTGVKRPWKKIKDENNTTAYGKVKGYEVNYRYLFPHVQNGNEDVEEGEVTEVITPVMFSDNETEGEFLVLCI